MSDELEMEFVVDEKIEHHVHMLMGMKLAMASDKLTESQRSKIRRTYAKSREIVLQWLGVSSS